VKDPIDDAQLIDLPEPRELTDDERRALAFAVAAPNAPAELRRQADTAIVVAECSCPCASIGLAGDGPQVPDAEPAMLLEASADNIDGQPVQVNLHLFDGLLHELEIWCYFDGEVRTAPLDVSTLEYVSD
jgi:hypothetical protein